MLIRYLLSCDPAHPAWVPRASLAREHRPARTRGPSASSGSSARDTRAGLGIGRRGVRSARPRPRLVRDKVTNSSVSGGAETGVTGLGAAPWRAGPSPQGHGCCPRPARAPACRGSRSGGSPLSPRPSESPLKPVRTARSLTARFPRLQGAASMMGGRSAGPPRSGSGPRSAAGRGADGPSAVLCCIMSANKQNNPVSRTLNLFTRHKL